LPLYSPRLNYIERVFSIWKDGIKKHNYQLANEKLENKIKMAAVKLNNNGMRIKWKSQLVEYINTLVSLKSSNLS